jgi:PAS domain S-box-containing protein
MTPQARIQRTRRLLVAGLTVVIAGSFMAAGFIVLRLRQEALSGANEVAAMHSRAFEDHLTLSLQAVDITIKGIAAGAATGNTVLFDILRNAPHLRSVSLLDASGRIVASSNPANVGLAVGTAAYFPPASAGDQLRIGPPVAARDFADAAAGDAAGFARTSGYIPVMRTLAAPGRTVAVLVALNADYFLNHFGQKLESIEGRVRVVRYDGLPLLSNTAPDELAGTWPAMAPRLESREYDVFDHVTADGAHFITAYHASRLYPFAVAVQLDRNRVLADWARESRILASVVLPILMTCALLGVVFYRRQRLYIEQRAENARTQRLAASVFEASREAILLTGGDARVIAINSAFTRLNGYTEAEIIGRNPRMLSSGTQPAAFYAAMWETVARDGYWQGELVNKRRDGSLYDAWLSISAVRDAGGTLLHYVGISQDISERKRHEQELVAARDRAEAGARAKAAFLATMSHEIRTPMNGIMGMTQLALMSNPSDKIRQFLTIAKSSADSLLTILNDILDFSKAEAGHLRIERRPLDPAHLVGEVADLFAARAAEKGIELRREIGPGVPATIEGDEVRLRQILTNLLSNAVKFTERGHATLSVSATDGGATLLFGIADTGIGIAAETQSQLFAPFAQADQSITRKYGGTGLGLAISRQLAELMGGGLTLESAPGTGSRFSLRLPIGKPGALASGATTAAPGAAAAQAAPADATPVRALTVLVAEDVPVNQVLMQSLLEGDGHRVVIAADGEAALAALRVTEFDLVLMDLQMPVMDGITATIRLRAAEAAEGRRPVPVIALTASVFPVDRGACLDAGMDDFLPKPVDIAALREAIARHTAPARADTRVPARTATAHTHA